MLGPGNITVAWLLPAGRTIFIRLCNLHPGPMKCGKTTDLRWFLILRDYHRIKQIVTGNTLLMQETDIQLAEVNTLIQWHNRRQTRLELSVRQQGFVLPPVVPVQPLKEAKVLPDGPMQAQEKHKYQLPKSTAGQGQQRQRPSSTHLPRLIMPKGPTKRTSVTVSPAPLPFLAPHLVPTAGVLQWVLPVAATQGPPTPPDKPSIRPQKKLRPPWRGHIDVWSRPINAKSVGSSAHSSNWPQPVPWQGLLSWFRIPVTRSVAVQDEK